MRYDTSYRSRSSLFDWSFTSGVKLLIVSNVAIFLAFFFIAKIAHYPGNNIYTSFLLDLVPYTAIRGAVWQLVTYLFLHDLNSLWHIVFNMLMLWMFGAAVEGTWGTRRFLQYYFVCGVGAGVCVVLANLAFADPYQRVIGASGAIYGLLLAYGMLFPEQTVLFMFLFPIKAKYMVMIFGVIAFLSSFQGGSTVSNLAHLGGMLFGFIYMKTQFGRSSRRGSRFDFDLSQKWKEYRLQRARRKFKVYLKKHGSGASGSSPGSSSKDPWVN